MSRGGPKTVQGKALVARNATMHGTLVAAPVAPGVELEEEWERHHAGILVSL
jgi:hypothetical protein